MDYIVFMALAATLMTYFVTALGAGAVVLFRSPRQRTLNLLLGFAAGVMIAASFWSLLQPAIQLSEESLQVPSWFVATSGFLLGALFIWISDKAVTLARQRCFGSQEETAEKSNRVALLILSITLHNIPEGLAVGIAFGSLGGGYTSDELMGAITVAVGIALQNFPEGAAVSLPLRREGMSAKKCFLLGQASGMVEPIAGVLGALLVVYVEPILPYALSFAAGAMILVAVHELIPECQRNQDEHPYFATMGIVAGFATMMLLDVMLG